MSISTKLFDAMSYIDKPYLGMSTNMSFIYEWEATLKDEGAPQSAFTIEEPEFIEVVLSRKEFEYVVVDIESLEYYHDPIAKLYMKIGQATLPLSMLSWWNVGPGNADTKTYEQNRPAWAALFQKRKNLVEKCHFGILGSYFKSDDTAQSWKDRHIPRIVEARKLYKDKPLFMTISPNVFDQGKPWPHISGELLGDVMDELSSRLVDGIVLWSFEGTGQLQTWDENWPWIQALRDRIGADGNYQTPT